MREWCLGGADGPGGAGCVNGSGGAGRSDGVGGTGAAGRIENNEESCKNKKCLKC